MDIFDREKVFIQTVLTPLRQKLPKLKIVMEHITTEDAVAFVESNTDGTFKHSRMDIILPMFRIWKRELHLLVFSNMYSTAEKASCSVGMKSLVYSTSVRIKPIVNIFFSYHIHGKQQAAIFFR